MAAGHTVSLAMAFFLLMRSIKTSIGALYWMV
jgi:hypothetical protein